MQARQIVQRHQLFVVVWEQYTRTFSYAPVTDLITDNQSTDHSTLNASPFEAHRWSNHHIVGICHSENSDHFRNISKRLGCQFLQAFLQFGGSSTANAPRMRMERGSD